MRKRVFVLLTVIFIISSTIGCGEKNDSSDISRSAPSSQSAESESSIDMKKLDDTMSILNSILKSSFGSDYSLVYDQGGVTISLVKEDAALAAALAKKGNNEGVKTWGIFVDSMQGLSTQLQEILNQNGFSDMFVTVQLFDKEDKENALIIVVDGKVTYDASK